MCVSGQDVTTSLFHKRILDLLLWRLERCECRGVGMPLHLVTENKHTAFMLRRLNVLLEFLHVQHLVPQEDRPSGTGAHKVLDRQTHVARDC